MDSASNLLHPHHRKWSVTVLSAMLSFVSAASLAAGPEAATAPAFSDLPLNERKIGLKLDLGLTMSGDDRGGDYADLMRVAAPLGSRARSVDIPQPAGGGEVLLAKLTLAEHFTTSATLATTPRVATHIAQTAPAAKSAAPAVAAPVAAPTSTVPAATPASSWVVVPADKTLNTALARWAAAAGWQLLWELPVDYAVSVRTEIRGSFEEAIGLVAKAMETAEIPMTAIFYEGNRVLRIVAKGAE
jgi:hypothetical protein